MRRAAFVGGVAAALCSLTLGSSLAHAQDAPPPEEPPAEASVPEPDAVSVVTLPLFGSSLMADVTTDAGGGLLDVTLTPAEGYDPVKVRPNKVSFVNEAQGVSVRVSAKRGGERVEARAGSLEEISGLGGWSGDVFDSGDTAEVSFMIGAGADGGPDITDIGVETTLDHEIGEVRRSSGDDDHGHRSASVRIEFTRSGQSRVLTIKAVLVVGDDGETHSALRIGLSRIKGRLLAEGDAVGPHSWSGQLCDGTEASFTYDVTSEGDVANVVATPEADVRAEGGRARVSFGERQSVSIKVRGEGDEMTVGTSERFRCGRNDPTVNGEAVDVPDDDESDGDRGDHRGWNDGDHGRKGGWDGGDSHNGDGGNDTSDDGGRDRDRQGDDD